MRSFHLRWLGCAVVLIATLAGCDDAGGDVDTTRAAVEAATVAPGTAATRSPASSDALPVIVDTDAALDDVMALLYLLRRDDVDVIAVTVSGTGVAHCEAGVSIATGVLAVAGHDEVPVACGSEVPLEGSNAFPPEWRSPMDRFAMSGVLPDGEAVGTDTASNVIAEAAAASEVPPVVLVLGPPTNLAQALRDHPELEQQVAGVHLMGGAVVVAGNTFENPRAEWNLWIDPVADAEVLATDIPVTVVPLDATTHVPVTTWFADRLSEHLATPEAQAVYDVLTADPATLTSGASFWDQLAVVTLVEPDIATWEDLDITVLQAGGPESAGTLAAGLGRPASVAMHADREAFEREFLTTLTGENVAASEWQPEATITVSASGWDYDGPVEIGPERFTVLLDNQSEQQILAVLGRLTGDATWDDLEAWGSIEQPPFLEVDGFGTADPRVQAVWTVEPSRAGENVLVGLDLTAEQVAWRQQIVVAE